jgi:hypothetical protein
MTETQKLKMCSGCRNNFYNGNNPYGVKRCWSLDNAEVVKRKRVHINQVPPWTQEPIKVLSCFHQQGYVFVNPNATC